LYSPKILIIAKIGLERKPRLYGDLKTAPDLGGTEWLGKLSHKGEGKGGLREGKMGRLACKEDMIAKRKGSTRRPGTIE